MSERLVRVKANGFVLRVLGEYEDYLWVIYHTDRNGAAMSPRMPWTIHRSNVTDLRFEVGRKYRHRGSSELVWTVSEVLPDGVAVAYHYDRDTVRKPAGARLLFDYLEYDEVT